MKVHALFTVNSSAKARRIAEVFVRGAIQVGHSASICRNADLSDADVLVVYGAGEPSRRDQFTRFVKRGGTAICVDLGYWRRGTGTSEHAYFRVAINHFHPQATLLNTAPNETRFNSFGVYVQPDRQTRGDHILLAGMGPKSCAMYGFEPYQWENETISKIRANSDRPIIYRPKPSFKRAVNLRGCEFSPPDIALSHELSRAHCVVTHHSNVGIDATLAGLPVFCEDGAARALYDDDLSQIEARDSLPYDQRLSACHHLANYQWMLSEVSSGEFWRWLNSTGTVRAKPGNVTRNEKLMTLPRANVREVRHHIKNRRPI